MTFVTYALALAALTFVSINGSIIVTGADFGLNASTTILPIRQNIENLQDTGPMWDLYILALRRFADGNETDPLSFYQISGIHGMPFEAWDEAFGNNDLGYCTHNSILFGSWHRVYLALFEQVITSLAQEIAVTYPTELRVTYEAAAKSLRVPYWDWANSSIMPTVITVPQIDIQGPSGVQTVQNPLYSYTFESSTNFPSRFFLSRFIETFRGPNRSGINQFDAVNAQLRSVEDSLRERTYLLISEQSQYLPYSNQGYNGPLRNGLLDSMEGIHNQVHGLLGGHMASVPFAAFDPVFWLHHTNLDRLEALWQAIYPQSYVAPQLNRIGTYNRDQNTIENSTTPLYPFHRSEGAYHTSQDARYTSNFGYTYPEIRSFGRSTEALSSEVRAIIEALYNRDRRLPLERRSLSYDEPVYQVEPVNPTYQDWFLNVRANRQMIPETYLINFFFGQLPEQCTSWTEAENRAGTQVIFSGDGISNNWAQDMGQLPLNRQLKMQKQRGKLKSFQMDDILGYLKDVMQWQVLTASGVEVTACALDCLKLTIAYRDVYMSNDTGSKYMYSEIKEVLELK